MGRSNLADKDSAHVVPPRQYKIHGMDCAEDVAIPKREIGPLTDGVENLTFDFLNGEMTVLSPKDTKFVVEAVGRTGMRADPCGSLPQVPASIAFGSATGARQ